MSDSLLPGFATTAPGLDEPLEILEACHGRIEQQLRMLEKLLDHLPRHGADTQAQQAATAVMRYFDTAGHHHHCDEEEDLFPLLRRRTAEIAPLLDALGAEHREMENAWAALREQLAAVAQGQGGLAVDVVAAFSRRYREHIARENRDVLPLAARVLTTDDLQGLSRAMTARRRIAT